MATREPTAGARSVGPDSSVTSVRATLLVQPRPSTAPLPRNIVGDADVISPVFVAGSERVSLCARVAGRASWCAPHDLSRNVQHASRREFIIYANRHSRQNEAILIAMHRRLSRPLLPSPKCGCSLAATLPASPATLPIVRVHVLRRKRMAFGAGVWHRVDVKRIPLAQGAAGEADHLGFGCFKARPRYH